MRFNKLPVPIVAGFLLGACVLQRPANDAKTGHGVGAVHESHAHYVLDRPFEDFYDTAFVLTDGGTAAPQVLNANQLADTLARYDVVFYGESHNHSGVHVQQMRLFHDLVERDPRWVLSLEQFERDVQDIVDAYLAGRVGEATLQDKGHAWNNYTTSYRPLVEFAKERHLPVVAAEAPGWTVSCVGQWGTGIFDQFTPLERSYVAADVHVTPGPYRDKYMAFLTGSAAHGGGAGAPTAEAAAKSERSFAAQVTRDDTMAESIERALEQHPGYKVLHLTGSFHAARFLGTVERLRLRDPHLKIAVIAPIEVADPRAPAFDADATHDGTLLQLIYPNPEDYVEGEDTGALLTKMTHAHAANRCKYSPPADPAPLTAPPTTGPPATPAISAPHPRSGFDQ